MFKSIALLGALLLISVEGSYHQDETEAATPMKDAKLMVTGYMVDQWCWEINDKVGFDSGANLETTPSGHTIKCMQVDFCRKSGYYLVQKGSNGLYEHTHTLDEAGNKVFEQLLKQEAGRYGREVTLSVSAMADKLVTVSHIKWADSTTSDCLKAVTEPTHQLIVADGSAASAANNFGMRNDILVTKSGEEMSMFFTGCPDHAYHQGAISASKALMGTCGYKSGCCAADACKSGSCTVDSCKSGCCATDKCGTGCCAADKCGTGCCAADGCSAGCCATEKCGTGCCATEKCGTGCCATEKCGTGCCAADGCSAGCCATDWSAHEGCCATEKCGTGCCAADGCSAGCCATEKCGTGCCAADGCSAGCCATEKCGTGCCATEKCGTGCCAADKCSAGCCGGCGGGCCSSGGCGGCGGGCCSASMSGPKIGKYTPTHHAYSLRGVTGKMAAMKTEAKPHSIVGVAVNGVPLMGLPLALNFDNCMGHTDTDHTYHYHLAPTCLFKNLGIPYPSNKTWWLEKDEDQAAFWPQTGPASPVVGFAIDGVPIMGPYDASGALTLSATLDECNGRTVAGEYQYVMTPDTPYLPTCFKGTVGSLTESKIVPQAACPKTGVDNMYHTLGTTGYNLPLPVCMPGVSQASMLALMDMDGVAADFIDSGAALPSASFAASCALIAAALLA